MNNKDEKLDAIMASLYFEGVVQANIGNPPGGVWSLVVVDEERMTIK